MKHIPLRALGLFVVGALVSSTVLAADKIDLSRMTPVPGDQPIPVADFFRQPVFRSPEISPDGQHIAGLLAKGEDRKSLMVYDTKTKFIDTLTGFGEKDIYWYTWINDQRLVYSLSADKLWDLGMFAVELDRFNQSYPLLQYCLAHFVSTPESDRTKPLVWMEHELETGRDVGVAVVNTSVHSGEFINLFRASGTMMGYDAVREQNERHLSDAYPVPEGGITVEYYGDRNGALEFAVTSLNGVLTLDRLVDRKWVKCPIDLDTVELITTGDEPGEIVVVGPREKGKPAPLRIMDAVTGKLGRILLEDPLYDFDGWLYRDPNTHKILGAGYQRNGPHVVWFDEQMAEVQRVLNRSFPAGEVIQIVSRSRVGRRLVTERFSDRQPPIYDWIDLDTHSAGLVYDSRPWIDPKRMQPMNILRYKTVDGKQLDAYLTLPAGASKDHPVPMIVLPHGGPYVRDTWGFDTEVQFLASRGYAVLQPNYRGSTSYDWEFPESDRWDFLKMRSDVTAAVKTAFATRVIDRKRVAIMGGSFGGYLALSGLVDEPSLYRCAVSIDGVFDWGEEASDRKFDQYDDPQYGWLHRRLGDPKANAAKYEAISPLRRADTVHVPMFVAHGKEDSVVSVRQSRELISALERNHVPCESMLVSDEGHGMSHVEDQVELYTRIEAFLAKNLSPSSATVAAK